MCLTTHFSCLINFNGNSCLFKAHLCVFIGSGPYFEKTFDFCQNLLPWKQEAPLQDSKFRIKQKFLDVTAKRKRHNWFVIFGQDFEHKYNLLYCLLRGTSHFSFSKKESRNSAHIDQNKSIYWIIFSNYNRNYSQHEEYLNIYRSIVNSAQHPTLFISSFNKS